MGADAVALDGNAVGEEGALSRYGSGQKAVFDMKRV